MFSGILTWFYFSSTEVVTVALMMLLFFGVPAVMIAWFIATLVKYRRGDAERRKELRTPLIVSGVTAGLLAVAVVYLIIVFSIGISHM